MVPWRHYCEVHLVTKWRLWRNIQFFRNSNMTVGSGRPVADEAWFYFSDEQVNSSCICFVLGGCYSAWDVQYVIFSTATPVTLTRWSPHWWSGRSTAAHSIVLDLRRRVLIWGFGESCTDCGITSQPVNVFSYVLYWHFRRSATV